MAVRVHDINERVAGNERRASVYICCHRAGKAKDLYSRRVFVRRERHWRRDDRGKARERQWRERKKEREGEKLCRASFESDVTRVAKREKRRRERGSEEGGEEEGERRGRWTEGGGARFLSESGQDK